MNTVTIGDVLELLKKIFEILVSLFQGFAEENGDSTTEAPEATEPTA